MKTVLLVVLFAAAAMLVSQPRPPERIGPQRDGSVLLPTGWTIRPAGRQVPLDTFPMSSALSPDKRFLLVLNGGYKPPSISVLETASMKEIGRQRVDDGWLGLTFSPNGRLVYVGGGSRASVFEFSFSPEGRLAATRAFPIVPESARQHQDFVGDVALSPDGRLLYVALLYRDTIAVINPQSGMVIERFPTGRRPYRILFHPDGRSYFVSSWTDAAVYHHNVDGTRIGVTRVGPHPTDMVWREKKSAVEEGAESPWKARIFVAAANTNTVHVLGVSDSNDVRRVETINIALSPRQPAGMTPSALALSPNLNRLFVVCSDANAVAVADISEERSRVLGFIPTGWYPTAARAFDDGRLVILNGRGLRSFPNPNGPNPSRRAAPLHEGVRTDAYVGVLQLGSASVVDPFDEKQLADHTRTVLRNSRYIWAGGDRLLDDSASDPNNPVPARPGGKSPIEHVFYIVKENRTYDQVLGDIGKGNSDTSLVLFGEQVSPNHHKLAREFVLFDNFFVNADVSADGHNWSTAAIASDYVQKLWPNSYGRRRRHYDYEGQEAAAQPPAGYLWSNAASAGVSMRNYGFWVTNHPKPQSDGTQIQDVRDPVLRPVTNLKFRGFDLAYSDVERAKVFITELAQFERDNNLPRLILMRLGNDHTSGTAAGSIAPLAAFADNDLALGMVVEAISKSRFWPKTAIFVLEDDAQNGPDHVDSHRAPAYVLSPYTRRGIIDSNMYNTTSMLRTMELILGIRPMTHFDAAALPMDAAFAAKPDTRPYIGETARIPLDERNPATSATAARSARMDLSEADRIDDDEMNDILWTALRGTTPPPPVRSFFSR